MACYIQGGVGAIECDGAGASIGESDTPGECRAARSSDGVHGDSGGTKADIPSAITEREGTDTGDAGVVGVRLVGRATEGDAVGVDWSDPSHPVVAVVPEIALATVPDDLTMDRRNHEQPAGGGD